MGLGGVGWGSNQAPRKRGGREGLGCEGLGRGAGEEGVPLGDGEGSVFVAPLPLDVLDNLGDLHPHTGLSCPFCRTR